MDRINAKSPTQPGEKTLLQRARRGDETAFNQLVLQFTPLLYRVVRRMASDSDEAQAVVQETFLRLWSSRASLQDDRPLFPYLVTVALNISRDQWRRARWLDFGGLDPVEDSTAAQDLLPEEQVQQDELLSSLAQAVAALPPAYRAVVALRYDAGLSYQEIAQILGLPVNTVRTHLNRAKAHLRSSLQAEETSYG